ncbi:hypothetical protein RZS08_05745 [Arthrospira platensis SPKY1]|nr:hypothetical protein [Arthrospira platensis SPKY1]
MAQDYVRLNAPGAPQLGQGIFNGKEGRLRVGRGVYEGAGRVAGVRRRIEEGQQGLLQFAFQEGGAALQRGAEGGLRIVERARHFHVLRALPGEEKGDARRGGGRRGRLRGRQPGNQLVGRNGRQRQALLEEGAARVGGIANVRQRKVGMRGEKCGVAGGQVAQRGLIAGRKVQKVQRAFTQQLRSGGGDGFDGRRRLRGGDNDVCVGAAKAEGADAGHAETAVLRPRRPAGAQLQAGTGQVDVRV